MSICPVTNATSLDSFEENTHFFTAILRPFGTGRQNLTREISLGPTYACKILSVSINVCGVIPKHYIYDHYIVLCVHDSVQL